VCATARPDTLGVPQICVITHNDEKAWDRNNGSVFVQPSERAFDPSAPPSPAVASQSFNEFTSEVRLQLALRPPMPAA
jgi:hypothetical protein